MPKKILFLYNQVSQKERKGYFSECTLIEDVNTIRKGLEKSNNHILSLDLETPEQLDQLIASNQSIDLAFVIAEGFKGYPQTLYSGHGAALVRKHLMKYQIPCTHSGIEGMEVCRNKDLTYAKLKDKGIFIPEYFVFDTHFLKNVDMLFSQANKIGYPLIVKPSGGGNSIGISQNSVVFNDSQLKAQIIALEKELGPGVLIIEKYLSGQEYTVSILGNEYKYILPIIGFPKELGVRDAKVKKKEYQLRYRFEVINELDIRFTGLVETAVNTFEAVNARDILRIDLKEDHLGNAYVIDVNGTPSLGSTGSLNFMSQEAGLTTEQLVNLILYQSMVRHGLKPNGFMEEIVANLRGKLTEYNKIEVA